MTKIIAFTGSAGSGKDLTAEIMTKQMITRDPNVRIRTLSFAAPIKLAVACLLDCDVADFDNREFKEGSLLDSYGLKTSPRQLMQLLGDDYARQMIDDQIWIKLAQRRFNSAVEQKADFLFITDLRYENEADWVIENAGTILYIDRPDAAPIASHASEAGLSRPPCYVIDNSLSIGHLRMEVSQMTAMLQRLPTQSMGLDDVSPEEWDRVARRCRYG